MKQVLFKFLIEVFALECLKVYLYVNVTVKRLYLIFANFLKKFVGGHVGTSLF